MDIGATRHKKPLRDEPNHHSCIAGRKGTRVEESTVTRSAKAPAPLPAAALHRQKILDLQSGARRITELNPPNKTLNNNFTKN